METATISIIVPVYNIIEYLPRCVESLRKQTYDKIEILLVDDGSTDGTSALCDALAAEDVRIRVFHKQNGGSSSARNLGIQEATGEYLGFVDSDDYVTNDYIDTLVREVDTAQLVCAEYFLVNENREECHKSELSSTDKKIMSANEAINMLQKQDAFQGYLWNKIFLRDIIINENIWFDSRIKIWEDMLFCLKYLMKIETVCYVGKPIYYYVQRSSSAMNNNIWKENTQLVALNEMWKTSKSIEGPFREYIKNYYANDLAGLLGKENFQDRKSIVQTIKLIESMKAKLSFKHKVKVFIFKYIKRR